MIWTLKSVGVPKPDTEHIRFLQSIPQYVLLQDLAQPGSARQETVTVLSPYPRQRAMAMWVHWCTPPNPWARSVILVPCPSKRQFCLTVFDAVDSLARCDLKTAHPPLSLGEYKTNSNFFDTPSLPARDFQPFEAPPQPRYTLIHNGGSHH